MKKLTLVTGGAKNLGATLCIHLAQKGYCPIVHYRQSEKEAEAVVSKCRSFGVEAESIQGDFSTRKTTEKFLEDYLSRFSTTSNLIHNVGNYYLGSPLNTSLEIWEDLFQVNFLSSLAITKDLLSLIKASKGNIIHIGISGIQNISASMHSTAYDLTKQSLLLLTKSLAKELAPVEVRVNMVSPGYLEKSIDSPKTALPMKRPGTFLEVAEVISFLLDPKNSYITGQNIEVAGGVGL